MSNPGPVTQEWTHSLSWKQQTVLLVALRGFDSVGKTDKSKPFVKALRSVVLNNADPNEAFMQVDLNVHQIEEFFKDSHHYPLHWFMHMVHAAQIVAYTHFDHDTRYLFQCIYYAACEMLHVNPETIIEMNQRLKDKVEGNQWLNKHRYSKP